MVFVRKLAGVLVASFMCACAAAPAPVPPEPGESCTGVLTPEDGERVKAGASQTRQCYERLLQSDRCATGKLHVPMQFEPSGSASLVTVDGRGFTDPQFYACIESVMGKIRIGEQASCVKVVVPLSFVPTETPEGCDGAVPPTTSTTTAPTGACVADELVWQQRASAPWLSSPCKRGDVPGCQEACERDGTAACLSLASFYGEGYGVAKDSARAVAILEQACSGGYETACGYLAVNIVQGNWGMPLDPERAQRLARAACRAGRPAACGALGTLYLEHTDADSKACATRLLQASCNADWTSACLRLAAAIADTDRDAALRLFEKACGTGYGPACVGLARAQLIDTDPAVQQQGAARLTARCNASDYNACNSLGYAFIEGRGVPKDPSKGVELLRKACVQEYPNGCDSLAEAYVNGWGVTADRAIANEYYAKACGWGHGPSCSRTVDPKNPK